MKKKRILTGDRPTGRLHIGIFQIRKEEEKCLQTT